MKPYMDMAGVMLFCPVYEEWKKEGKTYTKTVQLSYILNYELYSLLYDLGVNIHG